MGVAQLPRIVAKLLAAGASPNHPAAMVERGSLADQRVVRGTIATIVEIARTEGIAPPALLIVGEVASLAKADNDVPAVGAEAAQAVADASDPARVHARESASEPV
jgi:siroheme synthase